MVIVSVLYILIFIWSGFSLLSICWNSKKGFIIWIITGVLLFLTIFGIMSLPLSDEEKVIEIIQIEKYEGIKFDNSNEYIIIHNNSEGTTFSYLDSENISHELPINKCKLIATMGNNAYILVVDIIPYRGPFKFKSIGKEYRIFLPEKNINKLLYFENQL